MLSIASCSRNEITVSDRHYVEANSKVPRPNINFEELFNCNDNCNQVFNEPWIEKRIKKCIEDNTLATEIREPQFCVFIDDCISSGNSFVFCISDGRIKIPFKTSSNISENLNCYYNDQFNWTGYVIFINTYKLILTDANLVIESDDYVILEFDENVYNVINKRMKWLKRPEYIPSIADLMKTKLRIDTYIADDQKQDWKDILINNKLVAKEVETTDYIDKTNEDQTSASNNLQNIQNPLLISTPDPAPIITNTIINTAESMLSQQRSELEHADRAINLPLTSTPQSNHQIIKNKQSLSNDISCILEANISNFSLANGEVILMDNDNENTQNGIENFQNDSSNASSSSSHCVNGAHTSKENGDRSQKRIRNQLSSDEERNHKHHKSDLNYSDKMCQTMCQTINSNKNEEILSSLTSDVVLQSTKIQELREIKAIRDEKGKIYKLTIESQSENESSEVEFQDETHLNQIVSPESIEIDDDNDSDEIIENSQDQTVQYEKFFPLVVHIDHNKQVRQKVRIGPAEFPRILPPHVLENSWQCVTKLTVNNGKSEELIKILRNLKLNTKDFKQNFLRCLSSTLRSGNA